MTTPKITMMSFPEVAQIRKGMPKRKGQPKNGQDSWIVGQDLGENFRVAFAPGTEDAKATFRKLHPDEYKVFGDNYAEKDGFIVKRIRAMIPFSHIGAGWQWANEAHSAGRMVARADDTHFLMKRDPLTGAYLVDNGEPYTAFKHGDVITYKKGDKQMVLPIKTSCRLSLFLPELERFVTFTLKSTSFYDRVNIDAQLASIQMIADMFSNGNAAGVPFYVYRREQEICWNKPDGSAARIKKWLINIEADSEWVKSATRRMANFALTGEVVTRALLPMTTERTTIAGAENPDEPDYGDQGESVIDESFIDAESTDSGTNLESLSAYEAEQQPAAIPDKDRPGFITPALCVELGLSENEFSAVNMLKGLGMGQRTEAAKALPFIRKYRAAKDSGKSSKEAYIIALK